MYICVVIFRGEDCDGVFLSTIGRWVKDSGMWYDLEWLFVGACEWYVKGSSSLKSLGVVSHGHASDTVLVLDANILLSKIFAF